MHHPAGTQPTPARGQPTRPAQSPPPSTARSHSPYRQALPTAPGRVTRRRSESTWSLVRSTRTRSTTHQRGGHAPAATYAPPTSTPGTKRLRGSIGAGCVQVAGAVTCVHPLRLRLAVVLLLVLVVRLPVDAAHVGTNQTGPKHPIVVAPPRGRTVGRLGDGPRALLRRLVGGAIGVAAARHGASVPQVLAAGQRSTVGARPCPFTLQLQSQPPALVSQGSVRLLLLLLLLVMAMTRLVLPLQLRSRRGVGRRHHQRAPARGLSLLGHRVAPVPGGLQLLGGIPVGLGLPSLAPAVPGAVRRRPVGQRLGKLCAVAPQSILAFPSDAPSPSPAPALLAAPGAPPRHAALQLVLFLLLPHRRHHRVVQAREGEAIGEAPPVHRPVVVMLGVPLAALVKDLQPQTDALGPLAPARQHTRRSDPEGAAVGTVPVPPRLRSTRGRLPPRPRGRVPHATVGDVHLQDCAPRCEALAIRCRSSVGLLRMLLVLAMQVFAALLLVLHELPIQGIGSVGPLATRSTRHR